MALRLPPMQALRAFEAAARELSLTRAAQSLNLTHGAISHQIKALESDLGVRLVARAGRGIRLTDEGVRFAQRVRGALTELSEAVRELADRSNPRQLRISVTPSFAARWLLPRLASFAAAHPDLDLDVRASNLNVDFQRDDAEMAVRYGFGSWEGVISEPLLDERSFPVCSPRFAHGRLPKQPADLARHTLLRTDDEFWQPWFAAAGLPWPEPERGPIFNDTAHVMQAAVEGHGIALARTSLLGNDLRNGLLVRLFDIEVPSPRKYFLVYPPRLDGTPKLALFRQWLRDEIARDSGAVSRKAKALPRTAKTPRRQ
ncbi:MAG: transcriptional regulator GcvA [Casimicrobiaceae bacterium]